MDIYRMSPSKIENFRLYIDEEYNGSITLENTIKYIQGKTEWKSTMNYGSAIHAVLEHGHLKYLKSGGICVIKEDDFPEPITMTLDELAPVIEYRRKHPNLISEIKLTYELTLPDKIVQIPMRIDGIEGFVVHEHKNPEGSWHLDNYERSVQWKIYLVATNALCVQYNLFVWNKQKDGKVHIERKSFRLYHYPGIMDDIYESVDMLINFCNRHGLTEYIKPKKFED